MKKWTLTVIWTAALLSACAKVQIHFSDPADVEKSLVVSDALAAAQITAAKNTQPMMAPAEKEKEPADKAQQESVKGQPAGSAQPGPTENPAPEQTSTPPVQSLPEPVPESTPDPTPEPTSEPTPEPAPALAGGSIPFRLATGTHKWWRIDAADSAYWAVQENINVLRAAGGLPALSMDDDLSAIASTRCESFVAGGLFDHSGMVTKSEICAAGPLASAGAVCAAWRNSEAHYANIMRSDISRMGVSCWFCLVDSDNYTYWVVTFE